MGRASTALGISLVASMGSAQVMDGTYEVQFYNPKTKKVEAQDKSLPPGQIRRGLVQGKRFAILDMMSGFQGPIRQKGKAYEFVFEDGPAGRPKGKPEVAKATLSKDRKTLTLDMKGKVFMVWIWQTAKVPIKLPY